MTVAVFEGNENLLFTHSIHVENAFRLAARLKRDLPRVSRRSIGDVLRLAELGRRIIDEYLEVTAWGRRGF